MIGLSMSYFELRIELEMQKAFAVDERNILCCNDEKRFDKIEKRYSV